MEVIFGTTPSKSNSYRIIRLGNRCSMCKTSAVKKYEDSFYMQLSGNLRDKMITGFFEIEIDVYYPSMRSDLDNSLKVVLDCLQKAKAIKNDNKCSKIIARRFVDKVNPRIEFNILEV
jgi:Holliday junction resolvase RusA-like endonuclease